MGDHFILCCFLQMLLLTTWCKVCVCQKSLGRLRKIFEFLGPHHFHYEYTINKVAHINLLSTLTITIYSFISMECTYHIGEVLSNHQTWSHPHNLKYKEEIEWWSSFYKRIHHHHKSHSFDEELNMIAWSCILYLMSW
jgi:hypothetical protein